MNQRPPMKAFMRAILLAMASAMLIACATSEERSLPPLAPSPSVDLPRFMGTWHVIAHVPYFFEEGKVATRDEYRLRPDGRIDNDFVFKDEFGGPDRRWRGISTVVPGSGGARWNVQFVWPFSTELVVIHVDADYEGAALVTPNRELAWIFGRQPTMEAARYESLVERLVAQGVERNSLQLVPQVAPNDPES
ncbi:lipocalin family protein [Silanimonas sp.]|uniref:lipocalin family protein n=1 Tax=Silanimonas sp. TaxID=1929290 RepID=UPI0022BADA19|nr:lipocalin family protein [Silanimonas sp.]MCZ8061773.1 lipocalin family protein [Silanimonas sp.]